MTIASTENFGVQPTYPKAPNGVSPKDLPNPYYPSSVTSANIIMDASQIREWGGIDADRVVVDIKSQGPVAWAVPHFNRGDLSLSIAPRRPNSQPNLGVTPSYNGYSSSDPKDHPTQAWRPSPEKGVLLSTVAQNGQTWNDMTPGFYGTVASVIGNTGYGYSMTTGEFGNVQPSIDVTIGKAGSMGEGNIDVSVAWFPYDQGWVGGYIAAPSGRDAFRPQWHTSKSHSPNFNREISNYVYWSNWGASLRIPYVNSLTDGMLFTTSTDPGKENDDVNIVNVFAKKRWGGGWKIQQREDRQLDPFEFSNVTELMFAFLYVPFTAGGLIGGHINGKTGMKMAHAGIFESRKISEGQYEIQILGQNRKYYPKEFKTDLDGSLMLQVIGKEPDMGHLSKNAFISYNYTSNGKFIVEVRHMQIDDDANEIFPLTDTDFSFFWVDFNNPLTPTKETYTGFQNSSRKHLGFWSGFTFALLIALLCFVFSYYAFLHLRVRLQPSPFVYHPKTDALNTELLHSDFRFSE